MLFELLLAISLVAGFVGARISRSSRNVNSFNKSSVPGRSSHPLPENSSHRTGSR